MYGKDPYQKWSDFTIKFFRYLKKSITIMNRVQIAVNLLGFLYSVEKLSLEYDIFDIELF